MKFYLTSQQRRLRRGEEALTLIEMMVSTTCLLIIVLGLTAMFMQTQKAFKLGLKQNDVFDGGRAVADLLVRDLAQTSDVQNTNVFNCFFSYPRGPVGAVQNDANGAPLRTNYLEDVFIISRSSNNWSSIGYSVVPSLSSSLGVGTLYRYAPAALDRWPTNSAPPIRPECAIALQGQLFNFTGATNWQTNRVADGIIHLQIRAYDTNGFEILPRSFTYSAISMFGLAFPAPTLTNTAVLISLPASLELELGILAPEALEHLRALGTNNPTAQINYLASQAGQVQIFRQQIPIQTVTR